MSSRAKNLVTKYNHLVTQLRMHGVDFILATGKSPQMKAHKSRLRKSAAMTKNSGLFSSLNRGISSGAKNEHISTLQLANNGLNKRTEQS